MGKARLPYNNKYVTWLMLFCSEFGATYVLVFLGCLGCVSGVYSTNSIPHEQISWSFGLAVLIAVQCFGHLSGSNLNPIVTIASAILGYVPLAITPLYFLGQMIGALAGFGTVWLLTPAKFMGNHMVKINGTLTKTPGVCSPGIHPELSTMQGLLSEFVASGILVLVCCAIWDRKNKDRHDSVSVRFGLAVAGLAMTAGPFSGANMNPARSFAPALFNRDWSNHWVYWVGPIGAAFFFATFYKFLFNTPKPDEDERPEEIPLR